MAADVASTFGALLRSLRLTAGLTQETLAERAGLSVRALSDLERGARRSPYPHTVRRLGRALRLSAADRARLEAALPRRVAAPATLASPPPPPTNLPAALTSFIGRERELAEILRLLGGTRLLTLTGASGVGKTRLALVAAQAVQDDYPDGVWLAELAPLVDPALVPAAVAGVLGVREQPGRALPETLASWLASKQLLLVLDNCEHLLAGCAALVAALLRNCFRLRVLATGREALRLDGEVIWRAPSLSLPASGRGPDADDVRLSVERVLRSEAARLFAERAAAVAPGFAVSDRNAAAVARVCARLDGLPLALELAADRLDDRFGLLTGGSRAALPRHRTLRATLDWSHDLLDEPERVAFRRLAVFAGGWTLEAAEAVSASDGLAAADVLDLLTHLVDQSLVQVEATDAGAARYRLLETVRQYAGERLAEAGEELTARERHAAWCTALAEAVAPQLVGEGLLPALARLDAEQDNLRAALAWWAERNAEVGLRLAAGLRHYWLLRSRFAEARRWYEFLLLRAPGPTATRARALLGAAFVARLQASFAAAAAWDEEALALSRALGEARLTAEALHGLAAVRIQQGDLGLARPLLEEGVALCRAGGDRENLSEHLYYLGILAREEGEYGRARALLEESLATGQSVGDFAQAGAAHGQLGNIALRQGDDARAEALLEEALAMARRVSSPQLVASALGGLARVAAWRGDLARAERLAEESLAMARSVLSGAGDALALIDLGRVAYYRGEIARAVALLEEALALSRAAGRRSGISAALHGLGLAAWRRGDAAGALAHLRESLGLRRNLGNHLSIAECLEGLALVAAGTGKPGRAARLLGAAAGLRAAGGTPLPPVERPDHEATVAAARAALGEAAFAAAWAEGQAMTLDGAVAEAMAEDATAPEADATGEAPVAPSAGDGLTRREVEVLRLLAAGRSNRAIAADLALSVRTVERHVANLYGKIDAANRAEAAAYAVRRGLV